MPKLLFCVDHLFQQDEDGAVYTTGGKFPYSKWQEYLAFFDELTVVARGRRAEDKIAKLAISSGPGVRFVLVDDVRGAQRLATLRRQRRLLASQVAEADAVICRIPSELGITGCNLARAAGKPLLVELVACPWDALWNHGSLAAKPYAIVMSARTRAAVRKARLVHYVTREFLQTRYPTDAQAVSASNVMLPAPEPGLVERRLARVAAWRRGERPIVLGTIGALHTKLKGIDLALEAIAAIGKSAPPVIYRVLGEGDPARLVASAEKLGLSGTVHFDGVLPGAREVAGWLDQIDVYLQPSYQEGLPRATIEAMNRACLAIGSTVGGIPELLPAQRMHGPGDSLALGARIVALVSADEASLVAETQRNFDVAQHYAYDRSLAEKRRVYRALREWVDTGTLPALGAPM